MISKKVCRKDFTRETRVITHDGVEIEVTSLPYSEWIAGKKSLIWCFAKFFIQSNAKPDTVAARYIGCLICPHLTKISSATTNDFSDYISNFKSHVSTHFANTTLDPFKGIE